MNRNLIILLALLVSITFVSCSKSFLDVEEPSQVPLTGFYKDSVSVLTALTGVYNSLQSIYGSGGTGMFLVGDVATDNSYSRVTSVPNWDPLLIDASDGSVSSLWTAHYRCIGRANGVITNAPNVSMGDAGRNRFIAEAKFIRALVYFNAVRLWGKVPLVTKPFDNPDAAFVDGRNETDEVYNLIIQDISDAYNVLPDAVAQAEAGRATRAAVTALWGEVLLTQKKYEEAAAKLGEIVTNESKYKLSLLDNYSDIFSTSNEMNSEIIFAVRYTAGQTPALGSPFANQFLPIGSEAANATPRLTTTTAYSGNLIHEDLRDAFELGDIRKEASVDSFTDNLNPLKKVMYTKKFLNPNNSVTNDGNNDWIVYRYADILLLYAEALNENGKSALANIEVTKVRTRAGLPALTYTDEADLRAKILHERRVELNLEGKRWFDLLRNGSLISTLNAYYTKYNLRSGAGALEPFRALFPIPLTETQTNPKLLPNNDGYN